MPDRAPLPSVPPDTVPVVLGERSYTIFIKPGNLQAIAETMGPLDWHHAVVIADERICERYARPVADRLQSLGRVDLLGVPSGESSKSVAQAEWLWKALRGCGTDRKSVVVAVGGGVVGDLAGFVAATYARGIRFVQVPTTLLAQVDSSVGGKTGINLPDAKNMVGAFWQPSAVVIDPLTLNTLPDREYRAGLAEVVKYGVIMDPPFFEFLERQTSALQRRDPSTLHSVIARSCELKAEVVREDERETTGRRAILNYGHTFAHALEAVSGYGVLLHGEAVAIGMMAAAELARRTGRVDDAFVSRQRVLIEALQLPTELLDSLPLSDVMSAIGRDKKVEAGQLHFILPTRIGHVERVAGMAEPDVAAAFASIGCEP